jgi:diguanylate cyclase (GGDEF)-like protein/PAS domain S-box-containing protein
MLNNEARSTTHVALMTNPSGEIISWNDGCEALFGLDSASALGQRLLDLLAEDDRAASAPCLQALPTACDARNVHVLRPGARPCLAELIFLPAFGANGTPLGSLAFFTTEPDESDRGVVARMPLRSVIDALPGPFYMIRRDGTFALWNKSLEQVSGLSADEMMTANALDMYSPAEQGLIAGKIADVFTHDAKVFVEAMYLNKHGKATPYLLCGARIACHGQDYLCGMGLDISERREQEERLRLRERALHAASNGLVITGCEQDDHPIEYVNPAFERITGYSAAEVIGRDPRFMAAPGMDDAERHKLREAMAARREVNVVFRNRRKNGDIFWNDLTVTPVDDGEGHVRHFIGVVTDVTASKQRTDHLEHEVNHDPLTGLANRTLLWDRLEQALHMAQRNKSLVATVLLDLNGFKQINDTYGHEAGDAVLMAVARRLQAAVRESDTVARLSGDEFVLVLVNQPSLRYTLRMIERLRAGMAEPVALEGAAIPVGASMGVSVFPHDGTNVLELIRAADTAMYQAKSSKKNDFHFFSPDMKSATEAKRKLERDMHVALENKELFVLYQPKICLNSGRIRGLEALMRWRHPELGVLLPASFLPEAEENGMIIPFGNYVLEQVCDCMQRMQAGAMPLLPISVNVSYREFSRCQFADHVAEVLSRCDFVPSSLEVELREEGLNNNHRLGIEVLSQLRELGVQRAVDAFGAGLSDLQYLQQLPLTRLKIAKSAVQQICDDGRGGAVAKALIDVGHDLGLSVIAKGVETIAQMQFLKENRCDQLQGMVFSEPLPETALQGLLTASAI